MSGHFCCGAEVSPDQGFQCIGKPYENICPGLSEEEKFPDFSLTIFFFHDYPVFPTLWEPSKLIIRKDLLVTTDTMRSRGVLAKKPCFKL